MIHVAPEPRSHQKEGMSRVDRQRARRELKRLNKEIEMVRSLLHSRYEETQDLQDPCVHLTSRHLDTLIVRQQRLLQLTDKPPPALPPFGLLSDAAV